MFRLQRIGGEIEDGCCPPLLPATGAGEGGSAETPSPPSADDAAVAATIAIRARRQQEEAKEEEERVLRPFSTPLRVWCYQDPGSGGGRRYVRMFVGVLAALRLSIDGLS